MFLFKRVYDNATLRHVWQVGPIPLKTDGNTNSCTVYALGEAAVDFDIAPAVNVNEMQTNLNATTATTTTNTTAAKEQNSLINNISRLNLSNNRTTMLTEDRVC